MIAYIIWFSPVNGPKKIKMLPSAELRYTALLKYVPDLFCWSVIWRLTALLSVILPSGTAKAVLHMFQLVWCAFFSLSPFNLSKTPSPEGNTTSLCSNIRKNGFIFLFLLIAAGTNHSCRNYSHPCLQPGDVFDLQKCPTATQGEVGPSCKPTSPSGLVPESFRGLKCTCLCPYIHLNQAEYLLFPVLYYSNVLGVCVSFPE